MSRPNPFVLTIVLIVFGVIFGGAPLLKGGLYLDTHEGDTYHLMDILFRLLADGRQHIDFSTPLGVVAFLPFLAFIDQGFPVGQALIYGQSAVAAVLLPLIVYAAVSRMSRGVAFFYGFLSVGLLQALTYGGATTVISMSMYYNRWGWVVAFLVVVLAVLPARGAERPRMDSTIVGVLCGALLLLKMTYFVAVVPGAALALAIRWRIRGIAFAMLGGLLVVSAATVVEGVAFWSAYLGDLYRVTSTELRPYGGVDFNIILSGPQFIGATFLAAFSVLLVNRSGAEAAALSLLLIVPGWVFIAYQNFGNDPMWLWFLPIVLLSLRPEAGFGEVLGTDICRLMEVAAVIALALNFPSLVNSVLSPVHHAAFEEDEFVPMLPVTRMGQQNIYVPEGRAYMVTAEVQLDRTIEQWSPYSDVIEREPLREINGVIFPACALKAGPVAHFEVISSGLIAGGVPEGSQIFVTDILAALWFFAPFEPLQGGAPWYYGGLTGLENADYLVVPKCTFVARYRDVMIDELNASGAKLDLVEDNDIYALFTVDY